MADSGFPPPEYRPYTLIASGSKANAASVWLIIGALLAIGTLAAAFFR